MDFCAEVRKATVNMPVELAQKMVAELEASIEARQLNGECACGTPCQNKTAHDATDHILLLELKMIILQGGSK